MLPISLKGSPTLSSNPSPSRQLLREAAEEGLDREEPHSEEHNTAEYK